MTSVRWSSAKDFINICKRKTKTIIVGMIQQAQSDTFKIIPGLPAIQKQHHVKILRKDVVGYAINTLLA